SNLSLAASKHREDGAQRGNSSQRGCITSRPTSNRPPKQHRSGQASRPSSQGDRNTMRPTGRKPPKHDSSAQDSRPADTGGSIAAGYLRISGQCNKLLLVWQVSVATIQYFSYPVNTRTLQHSAQAFHFPAVTFCNLNQVRASAVRDTNSRVGRVFSSFANVNASNATNPEADPPKPTTFPSVEDEWDDDGILDGSTDDLEYATETTEFQAQERFGRLFGRLSRKQRQKAGHKLSAMLLSCSWNGRLCNAK
ncbi:hypothetical protein LSAT2_012903, partial [Lamellibrachia satsuma]